MRRWAVAPSLLVASVLFGAVTGSWVVAALLGSAILLSVTVPGERSVDRRDQLFFCVVSVGIASVLTATVAPTSGGLADQPLTRFGFGVAVSALLVAAGRNLMAEPVWGARGTLAIGLLVLLSCGTRRSGFVFPALALSYLTLVWVALHIHDAARPRWTGLGWRHYMALVLLLGTSTGLGVGFALALPPLYERSHTWIPLWSEGNSAAGFQTGAMRLGSLDRMLQSSEVVLRLYGPVQDHLRGEVMKGFYVQ